MNKNLLFLVFLFSSLCCSHFSKAQPCTDCRYLSPVFDSVTVQTVRFGEGRDSDNNMKQLYMDIYQPYGDTAAARPVLIFAFGGAFIKGARTDWYVKEVCRHFSKVGYVCAAIDYRVGINPLEILQLQHMRIFFRPMQDMRASVQYLKADFSELGNNFRIDTNNIILGGASSGAITALMTAYCDKPSELAEMGNLSAINALGGFYSTSGMYPNYSWNGVAVVNMAGAIINADWIEPGDIPHIAAHGNKDNVVPYGYGPLGGGTLGGIFDLQGSYVVDSAARAKGVCSYLFTMEGHDHPNTGMGMDYIKSVVTRMAVRCYSAIRRQSFCCPLSVEVTPGDTLFYKPGDPQHTISASISNDNGNASLQWCSIKCDVTGSSPSVSLTPDTALKYVIAMTREGQCESSDLYILIDTTAVVGLNNIVSPLRQFSVYPQPASQFVMIEASLDNQVGDVLIELMNANGQLLRSKTVQGGNQIKTSMSLEELPAGNYVLRMVSENGYLGGKKLILTK